MKIGLVIIKAVGNQCNLQCRYCYALPRTKNTVMSAQTLKQTIKSIASLEPIPIYFWSGGEPLLAGKNFFRQALNLQSIYCHKTPVNSLQTNGLLIDRTWIDFIKENNIQVGISWDGLTDSARVTVNGETAASKIWQSIELCLNESLRFGVITVITQQNVKRVPQIAKTLYSLGIKNLLCKPYVGPVKELSLDTSDYAELMCRLLDLWLATKDNDWIIEPLYSFIQALTGNMDGLACYLVNNCGNFLTIEYNGDITCCDFVPQRFAFGNVHKVDIKEITVTSAYKEFVAKAETKPEECVRCSWDYLCGGGCLHYRKFDTASQKWGKYILCEARKKIFDYCNQQISK